MSAALLEAHLEALLIKKLPHMTSDLEVRLFKNRGPLADFDSKILVATATTIIREDTAKTLDSIRVIRNAFGHSIARISFDTKEISDEIQRHILPFCGMALSKMLGSDTSASPARNHKFIFTFAVCLLQFFIFGPADKTFVFEGKELSLLDAAPHILSMARKILSTTSS